MEINVVVKVFVAEISWSRFSALPRRNCFIVAIKLSTINTIWSRHQNSLTSLTTNGTINQGRILHFEEFFFLNNPLKMRDHC